jgi:hypothetical protein
VRRRCDFCGTPLLGKKGHGFVEAGGKIRCSGSAELCERRARRTRKLGLVIR